MKISEFSNTGTYILKLKTKLTVFWSKGSFSIHNHTILLQNIHSCSAGGETRHLVSAVQWRVATRGRSRQQITGLEISDKDIGDGGDTAEEGLERGQAGEHESLHELQDPCQDTIAETLGNIKTGDGGLQQGLLRHGCRDEAYQV